MRRLLLALRRRIEPSLKDILGWIARSAPRRLLRLPGRLWRWAPGALKRWLKLAAFGLWWLLGHMARYVIGYRDYGGMLREAEEENQPRRVFRLRRQWRRATLHRLTAVVLLAGLLWLVLRQLTGRYGWLSLVVVALVVVVVLAVVGRVLRGRQARTPEEAAKAEGEPFPIADAHTRTEAAECITRALKREGIELRGTDDAERQPWGWQIPVVIQRGKPADVIAKLGELETTLDLPQGGLLAAPDKSRRARVVLRLAQRDPFTNLTPAVAHLPGGASICDSHIIGRRMDGTGLAVSLFGVHVVVIGVPGSGKSITLRTLAEMVSACYDALVWDLDPAGNGLDVLGGAIARRERDPAEIENALDDALALAEARPKLLSTLDMGDAWQPSYHRPAVVVFIDEYPRLTDRAKALAVDLVRIGRKGRVTLVFAASEATSDTLGAAIADITALKILMPCRHSDVRLVLGPNMIAEGWRPDRLNPATGDSPEDAGKCYVYAAGSREPIISKIRLVKAELAREQGHHRAEFGLPQIDADSWTRAQAIRQSRQTNTADMAAVHVLRIFDSDDRLWTEEILARLTDLDADAYGTWTPEDLSAALRRYGVGSVQVWRHGRNRRGYLRADLVQALGRGPEAGS